MRRILAAVALSAVALLGAGCTGTNTATPSSSASATGGASASATPSADPSVQAICTDLKDNILNTDAKAFGAELGKLVTARASGDKAAQTQAQQNAVAKLHEISGKLRKHADEATDPQLKTALTDSATSLDQLAADTSNFEQINSLDAVSQTTQKFVTALNEVTKFCA